jgi:hypothetical protein
MAVLIDDEFFSFRRAGSRASRSKLQRRKPYSVTVGAMAPHRSAELEKKLRSVGLRLQKSAPRHASAPADARGS